MKKAIFGCLAILLVASLVMIGCDLGGIGGPDEKSAYTFDSNGNVTSVTATVSKDGSLYFPPISTNGRALSKTIASSHMNYFEVVFKSATKTVSANWLRGESANIDVDRGTTTGIDYFGVNPTPVAGATGAAVLFAGNNNYGNSKTLLAVGRIILIDDQPVTTTAVIDSKTKSVTFGLSALEADASKFTVADTTMPTPSPVNFKKVNVKLGNKFPIFDGYILRPGVANFTASYVLTASAGTFPIADMLPAFRVVENATILKKAVPVAPLVRDDKAIEYTIHTNYEIPTITPSITPAYTDGAALPSATISFTMNTTGSVNGITGLYFQIPVRPLDSAVGGLWYIRPGHFYEYLETSPSSYAGSILFAVNSDIDNMLDLDFDYPNGLQVSSSNP